MSVVNAQDYSCNLFSVITDPKTTTKDKLHRSQLNVIQPYLRFKSDLSVIERRGIMLTTNSRQLRKPKFICKLSWTSV